ncbi:unnamed protein product [Rhizopus stolonifer]
MSEFEFDAQKNQAKKAIKALSKVHLDRANDGALIEDNCIMIEVTTHTFKKIKHSPKPKAFRVECMPYENDIEICLVTKSDVQETEKLIQKNNIPYIKKVVNPQMLKTTYKQFEARRKLASSYDMFVFDDRIYHIMPDLFGKSILGTKKLVVPISMAGNLNSNLKNVLTQVYARPTDSQIHNVLIGNFDMKTDDLLKNYLKVVPKFVNFVSESWDTVNVVSLKAKDFPPLPIICNFPVEKKEKKTVAFQKKNGNK